MDQRTQSEIRYMLKPNHCKQCYNVIKLQFNRKPSEIRKKQFCNHSCSAAYNNIRVIRKLKIRTTNPELICECGKLKSTKKAKTCIDCRRRIIKRKEKVYCKYCKKLLHINRKGNICNTCVSRIKRIQTKEKTVKYLGGKCKKCGYNKHLAALEFHHTSDNKDFNIGKSLNRSWSYIKKELDKCELLCSNCHRIEHSKHNSIEKLTNGAVSDWQGS